LGLGFFPGVVFLAGFFADPTFGLAAAALVSFLSVFLAEVADFLSVFFAAAALDLAAAAVL